MRTAQMVRIWYAIVLDYSARMAIGIKNKQLSRCSIDERLAVASLLNYHTSVVATLQMTRLAETTDRIMAHINKEASSVQVGNEDTFTKAHAMLAAFAKLHFPEFEFDLDP
jgi:hypothetical protein